MMRRLLAASVVVTVALVTLSALGAGAAPASGVDKQNGEAKRSPAQVVADAAGALSKSSSFKLTGSFPSKGKTASLEIVVTSGHGGGGTIEQNGTGKLDFVVAGPYLYFRADAPFWMNSAKIDQAQADQFAGKWFRTAVTNKQVAQFAQYTDMKYWRKNIKRGGGAKFTKGSQRIFRGAPVVAVHNANDTPPSTLLVAATGKPFPVAIVPDSGGPNAGMVFSSWNSATPPAAPTGAVNLPNS
jgi:hypothetical protein